MIWIIFNNKTKQKSQNANSQLNQASHHSRTKEIRTVLQPKIADSVVIDTETIGYGNDLRIIEIGAVFLQNKKIIKTYTQLINPKQPISSITRQLTGITDKDLEKQPEAQEIIPMFLQSIRQLTIIGHNISYDINALNYEAQRLNILPIKNTSIVDTIQKTSEKHAKKQHSGSSHQHNRLHTSRTHLRQQQHTHRNRTRSHTTSTRRLSKHTQRNNTQLKNKQQ